MKKLYNTVDKKILRDKLANDPVARITLSFYRYVIINEPEEMRNRLYDEWQKLGVLGRIYIAREGINAQLSVPQENFENFKQQLYAHPEFKDVPFKIAIEDDGKSFIKLIVRLRPKIVADGLDDGAFDVTNVGNHLDAEQFNAALDRPDTVVVDMRNFYESEVGHFKGAILPDSATFREELPKVENELKGKEDKKILLYCTGGIRCEKASAYLKHKGFKDVNQLYGGIINYTQEIKSKGLESKFIGKNFVFDERLGERITDDIIGHCHQCGKPCDTHTNCLNDDCHLLFIQCEDCAKEYSGCCTPKCQQIASMSVEEQRALRKGQVKEEAHNVFPSRRKVNLRELIEEQKKESVNFNHTK